MALSRNMTAGPGESAPASAQPELNAWSALWQTLIRFQKDKIVPWLGLRNTLGVVIPLAVGVALGDVQIGLMVSIGALNVCYSDSHEPYILRAGRMLAASTLVAVAVFAGSYMGNYHVTAIVLTGIWAFVAGLLVALDSSTAADLGMVSLVTVIVYSAFPQPLDRAVYVGCLAFAGGLFQTALSLALWPVRRHFAERKALGDLFMELARAAADPVEIYSAPPASAESTRAQTFLAPLSRSRSVEGQRFRSMLNQAERMRICLLTLARLRIRLRREPSMTVESAIVDSYLATVSRLLLSLGTAVITDDPAKSAAGRLAELETFAEDMRSSNPAASPQAKASSADARFQMDALNGQLRSAVELAGHTSSVGLQDFERQQASAPWRLRLTGTFAILRANLSLDSAACRHAIRLAVCVAGGDALARGLHLYRPYWLPMTVSIVLKPDFSATISRGVLRLAGTFVGLVFATVLFHVLHPSAGMQVVLIAILMYVMRTFGAANYGALTAFVTALVVLLIALTGVTPKEVVAARGLNTLFGGVIALGAYWLWPTWERTQVPEALARMLDAYRAYFHAIRKAYQNPQIPMDHLLDETRVGARLARSNLEASVERLNSEPGSPLRFVSNLMAILASSHRMIHACMALEAGLSSSSPVPARPGFRQFANDVERTLYYLAAALRGFALGVADLPDLREDHHALVHSSSAVTERYMLVNVETDRITNSVNTLSEGVLRLLESSPAGSRTSRFDIRQNTGVLFVADKVRRFLFPFVSPSYKNKSG